MICLEKERFREFRSALASSTENTEINTAIDDDLAVASGGETVVR